MPERQYPALVRAFRFQVKLFKAPTGEAGSSPTPLPNQAPSGVRLGDGAFQECSGLEVDMDVQEYLEGGRNDGVIRRVGRARYQPIVLKRGMFFKEGGTADPALWDWLQGVVAGRRPVARYNGVIEVLDVGEATVATWVFDRGLPAKISGPQLNARTGEIAIEELQIVHEGLRLVVR
jgi:phage tail-like protein